MVLSLQKIKIYVAVILFCYLCYFIQHFILSTGNMNCMVGERESKRAVLLKDESLEPFYRHIIDQRKIRQRKKTGDFKMEPYRDPRWRSRKPELQILLVSYINAGSTYLGNILRQNTRIFYVYHPVVVLLDYIEEYRGERMYLYKKPGGLRRKDLREHRVKNSTTESNVTMKQLSKDLINDFLDCNFTALDIASLTNLPYYHNAQTRNFSNCILDGSLVIYIKCLKLLYEACNNTDVTLVNSVQLPVKTAMSLLIQKPELKLIYLYRDPRATLWTQFNNGVYKWATLKRKAKLFCSSLLKDLMTAQNITKMFPNRFVSIKYEDLVRDTKDTFRSMYQILGLGELPKDVEDYITSGKRIVGCSDCVESDHNAWRLGMPYEGAGIIDMNCARVYKKLGYELITGQEHLRKVNQTLEFQSNFL
ncbi:hypothetical protein LOTGIDRAFT_159880 [Lottia gigantea]|uniref:Uncharacterized protein n=1 Tax=Lottia gigantea TaxID=225164 RepID=V4AHT6_LOTGI|nr:hypothetical protein LOTGIDRAFT_159880 [Lottia gigantea]ESO96467.1 hypothetical protein LOTGIDRAFT_159880 [Lottia gigantea]